MVICFFLLLAYSSAWGCGLAIDVGDGDTRAGSQSSGSACCSGSASGSGGLSSSRESTSATMTTKESHSRYSTEIVEGCESPGFWEKVSTLDGLADEKLEAAIRNITLARILVEEVIMMWSGEDHSQRNTIINGNCSAFKLCTQTVSNASQILARANDLLWLEERCKENVLQGLEVLITDPAACKSCLSLSKQFNHSGGTCRVKLQNFSHPDGADNCTWSDCFGSIRNVELLFRKKRNFLSFGPDSDGVVLLRELTVRTTAEYIRFLRMERALSNAFEKCTGFLLKNCSERFASARFALSAERTVLAAAVVTFKTILNLRALGGLVSWGERARAFVHSRENSSQHLEEEFSMRSLRTTELFKVLCEQFHSCDELDSREICSSSPDIICLKAKRSVLDSRDFSSDETSANLMSTIELICGRNVSEDGKFKVTTPMSNLSNNSCQRYCPPLRKCPQPHFIESSYVDLMAFSPDEIYRSYVHTVFRRSGLTVQNTTNPKNCRFRCRWEISGVSEVVYYTLRVVGAILLTVSMAIAIFGVVLVFYNQDTMLENPRQPFLLFNLAFIYNRLGMIGVFLPNDYVWCNPDGSFAIYNAAGVLCKVSAWLLGLSTLALPLALLWKCYIWHKTLQQLVDMQLVQPSSDWRVHRVIVTAIILLPWFIMASHFSFNQWVEGIPLVSACIPYSSEEKGYFRRNIYLFSRFSLFPAALFFFRCSRRLLELKRESDLFRPHPALEMWRQRHRWLFILGVVYLIPALNSVFSSLALLFKTAVYHRAYGEVEFHQLGECFALNGCQEENQCRVPGRILLFHVNTFSQLCIFDGLVCILGFGWIFFKEVKWPVLKKVKAWINSRGVS